MSVSLINHYIKQSAHASSIEKGWVLFQNGNVVEFLIHDDGKVVEAEVEGQNGFYNVFITDYKNMNIEAECDCPYDWGGICKHCVAALYKLVEKLDKYQIIEPSIRLELRRANTPLLLEHFEILSSRKLERYVNHNYYGNDCNIERIQITNEGLSFIVSEDYYDYEYVTRVYKDGKQYYCYCTCGEHVKLTCKHESVVIENLLNAGKQIFPFLKNGKMDEIMLQSCKKNELPEKFASSEYMQVDLDKDYHPVLRYRGELEGLINEQASIEDENFYKYFNRQVKLDKSRVHPLFESQNMQKKALAFVFQFGDFDYGAKQLVVPIVGKLNAAGTKIISNIEQVTISDLAKIKVSDQEKEMIVLCEQIQGIFESCDVREYEEILGTLYNRALEVLKKLYFLLDVNPFVYKLKNELKGIAKSNLIPVSLSSIPISFGAKLISEDIFVSLIPHYKIGEELIDINNSQIQRRAALVYEYKNTLHLVKTVSTLDAITFLESVGVMKSTKAKINDFLANIVIPFAERFRIDIDGLKDFKTREIFLKPLKKQVYLSEINNYILFSPVLSYNHKKEADVLTEGNFIEQIDDQIRIYKRDEEFENDFISFIRKLHPDFIYQEQESTLGLPLEEMLKNNWFFDAFEAMKENDIEVLGLQQLKSFKHSPYRAKINTGIKSGQDWFDVNLEVSFGDYQIPLNKLKKHILNKEKFIKLGDGSVGMLPTEWIGKLEKYFRVGEISKDKLKVSKLRFGLLDELFENIDDTEILAELAQKKKRLESFTEISKVRKPAAIKAKLRDYQKEGLNWMNFLNEMGWGGILADDMGLGKTLQILAFLASLKNKKPKTSLVVLPTTLIFNWENEINKFYPSLKAMFYYGSNREKDSKEFKNFNVVITTYGLMVNDIEMLSKVKFNYIILDESQAIKNPLSKRYKAACLLQGKSRLTLTGTPIENNTFDLYAQMTFVNPGLLGTTKSFKDYYSSPIDKEKDPGRANELRKLISPFVMRRTKEQVATELPPKTEDVVFCQMDHAQRAVYEEYKNRYRDFILNKIDEEGIGKSKMSILEGLLKLRQICNNPALMATDETIPDVSVKQDELMRQINDKTGKHKIVIFSQFVKMLKMIEKELQSQGYDYEYFDGSSSQKKRKESVARFQNDENCRVFLISLKAGGTGINLTAADYVYIFDPWWNPAVETQAIDRTYRIGQDKKVFAYRMICKDTVEEKILQYQAQKKSLAADIIRTDESFVKQLSADSIKDLFG